MAKRGRTGPFGQEVEDEQVSAREDIVDETDTDTEPPRLTGSEAYKVVEPGTIIDGVYFPQTDCEPGQEMIAMLDPAQAQALADGGMKLVGSDGEQLVPSPVEEPEVDEPDPAA